MGCGYLALGWRTFSSCLAGDRGQHGGWQWSGPSHLGEPQASWDIPGSQARWEQPLASLPNFILGTVVKLSQDSPVGQPALRWCSVVTAPSLLHFSQWSAALKEGSPDMDLFNPQVGDGEAVLFSCHFKHLFTSYDIQP